MLVSMGDAQEWIDTSGIKRFEKRMVSARNMPEHANYASTAKGHFELGMNNQLLHKDFFHKDSDYWVTRNNYKSYIEGESNWKKRKYTLKSYEEVNITIEWEDNWGYESSDRYTYNDWKKRNKDIHMSDEEYEYQKCIMRLRCKSGWDWYETDFWIQSGHPYCDNTENWSNFFDGVLDGS